MFLNEFSVLLEDLAVVTGNLIITGDFNFHFENANNRCMLCMKSTMNRVSTKNLENLFWNLQLFKSTLKGLFHPLNANDSQTI